MSITSLVLQNFRSYTQEVFQFSNLTVIVGPNTAGKSNLIEALYLLSSGKSFRAEKDTQMVRFGQEMARVKGKIQDRDDETILEVVVAKTASDTREAFSKRFLINNLPKRRVDFMERFHALLFVPSHLDIIVGSPSLRRNFFDEVLEAVDRDYRIASIHYEKALRQRNALLHTVRETGRRDAKVFEYWDDLLIQNGQVLTKKREEFLAYCNQHENTLIEFQVEYDKSIISEARLEQYKAGEEASGVTLVGPHRDDFVVYLDKEKEKAARSFGSRGQQRLVVLQLKLLQLQFMEERLGVRPVLLLDDIFSELDDNHIQHVLDVVGKQQTIMTTTHKEFITKTQLKDMQVVNLAE